MRRLAALPGYSAWCRSKLSRSAGRRLRQLRSPTWRSRNEITSGDAWSRSTFEVSRWLLSQLVHGSLLTELSERKRLANIERTDRRFPHMGEHESRDIHRLCSLSNVERRSMSANALGKSNRAIPAGGVGEHDLRTSGPPEELQESGRPRRQ